jgi:hypothetical protein
VAVIGATVATRLNSSAHTTFTDASRIGWYIMSGSGFCVLVLGIISTSGWARATAQRAAAAIEGGQSKTGM